MDLTFRISQLVSDMEYYYSAKTNAFYPDILIDEYKKHGTFPDDAVLVTEACFNQYSADPEPGKMRVADKEGMPSWGDQPEPTREMMVYQASEQKNVLRDQADKIIAPLKDAKEYGIITEVEDLALKEWAIYRYNLSKVDVETYPDINWPTPPEM